MFRYKRYEFEKRDRYGFKIKLIEIIGINKLPRSVRKDKFGLDYWHSSYCNTGNRIFWYKFKLWGDDDETFKTGQNQVRKYDHLFTEKFYGRDGKLKKCYRRN